MTKTIRWSALRVAATILLTATLGFAPTNASEIPTGTLVLDLADLESDVQMKKNIRKQLEHAGLRWGIADDGDHDDPRAPGASEAEEDELPAQGQAVHAGALDERDPG